ncbi:heme ABC exporter ATP-binding protein CcmA [Rhodovulum sp. DZ06]|uniref:heme ABC exporter ATP-binding protein CcmA n=1 Tax=Rhodovulum sp. DZ06 TaxID=3425126 RepID=UPI003D328AFF
MELTVHDLACRRAGRLVFSGAAFSLRSGEIALLRGPNGSGKSSLIRVLAGMVPIAGGRARLDRGDGAPVDLAKDGETWRESVALAGHLDAVKPALTVRENLDWLARLHGTGPDRAQTALEAMRLAPLADDPAAYCSAGQKRRLGLARLLVMDRPLWLLDEPTVSLDAESAAMFARIVRAHVEGGGMAVAATHIDLGLGEAQVVDMGRFGNSRTTGAAASGAAPGGAGPAAGAPPAPGKPALDDPFLSGEW